MLVSLNIDVITILVRYLGTKAVWVFWCAQIIFFASINYSFLTNCFG